MGGFRGQGNSLQQQQHDCETKLVELELNDWDCLAAGGCTEPAMVEKYRVMSQAFLQPYESVVVQEYL